MNPPPPDSNSQCVPAVTPPGMSVPVGSQTPTEMSSPTSFMTRQPMLGILIGLALVGALTLAYQVLLVVSDTLLWVLVAIICTLVVTFFYWRPFVDRTAQPASREAPSKEPIAEPQTPWWNWKSLMAMAFFATLLRGLRDDPRPPDPNAGRISGTATSDLQTALRYVQQRQATAAYWQTAVASLHTLRFGTPSDTESTQGLFERISRKLQQQVEQARAASTTNVDAELIAMVRRHLELDDRMLKILAQIPGLMKAYQVNWGTESAAQSAVQWQEIQAKLVAQPELWEKLPPEGQQIVHDVVALEQQQQEQFREIELMQAVLQERYKGVSFPLPPLEP
jgi:hypothetical protein